MMSQFGLRANKRFWWRRAVIVVPIVLLLATVGLVVANQVEAEVVVAQSVRTTPADVMSSPAALSAEVQADEVLAQTVVAAPTSPPTAIPPTVVPATPVPPTAIPPTAIPPTSVPPTVVPATSVPPTVVPATPVPPTAVPTVAIAPTSAPVPPVPEPSPPTAVPAISTPTAVPAPAAPAATPTPVAVVPAPAVVPTQVPAIPASPTFSRNGPAGVVSQIPNSAWRWLDAYGWKVDWRQGPGPGRVSEAQYATNTIVIWYDTRRSDTIWAGAFAHELGHAVSYVHFGTQQMNDWNAMRGLSSWRWVPGTPTDFGVGEGDFAEAFMSYLLGHQVRSVGGPLTQEHRAWIAANTPF